MSGNDEPEFFLASPASVTGVSVLIGRNMRRLREQHARVLADVAAASRRLGVTFKWDASAVSRIETGRRVLTIDEVCRLPAVMTEALETPIDLVDLLADVDDVPLGPERQILGQPFLYELATFPSLSPLLPVLTKGLDDLAGRPDRTAVQLERRRMEDESPIGVQAVAAELDVDPEAVLDALERLGWSSIQAERERRLRSLSDDMSNAARIRTLRGHLRRQLVRELQDELEQSGDRHGSR